MPPIDSLRLTDRKTLLRHLVKLGAPDPDQRAAAALAATELLRGKGLDWSSLVVLERDPETAHGDHWRDLARRLSRHPDATDAERAHAGKMVAWRSPGANGLAQLEAISERLGSGAEGADGTPR